MPGPPPNPVQSDTDLPRQVDVAVIGGGIIGTCTALELAERGHSVALFEKGEVAGEQSGRNWGWVRLSLRDPREVPLMLEALRGWESFSERLENPTGFRRCGILFAYGNQSECESYQRWLTSVARFQPNASLIGRTELQNLAGENLDAHGALYTPNDARAEPQWAAPAVAEGARARGARLFTHCAVRGIETSAGLVQGIVTEKGPVRCDAVVLAGGAWSRLLAGSIGIDVPQLKVLNTVLRTTPVEGGPDTSLWTDGLAWRKRADGGYTIADGGSNLHGITPDSFRQFFRYLPALWKSATEVTPRLDERWRAEWGLARRWPLDRETVFERARVLDPTPSQKRVKKFWQRARQTLPVLEHAEIAQVWGGLIDVTPDIIPVISPVDDLPGLTIATGFSGHGFGIAPGAGKLAADLVTGRAPVVDPRPFRLSRFFDGSPLVLDGGF